ncbi:restriction endonuclease subunit R [bacterium]|nr:restriction endonuclease subunit R [bacterium]
MELKDYQRRVMERFSEYIELLYAERSKADKAILALKNAGVEIPLGIDDYAKNTWNTLKASGILPRFKSSMGLIVPEYVARYDARKRSTPHICLKVPTGGGKTLLAAECVGAVHTEFFRRQTGLVLWIVPTVQIYRQTWKALANREHPYRQSLERASGGRIKVFEKDDPITTFDIQNYLCVMMVRLAAANRTTNKEFLKIFRDAGKYISFFPEVDDYTANNELLKLYPDLEVNDIGDTGAFVGVSVKHSLLNLLKMLRPMIIIDEGHKAYSDNTRQSLNNFNPSFILELTATPNPQTHISNVLVNVSGSDLKDEQMIKLPINIMNTKSGDWEGTLAQAQVKLENLSTDAIALQAADGRYIRPIMVVRVERTGKDQRDGKRIHALDVRDYLINRLSVDEREVRIKSSEKDELGNEDLLSPLSTVRYIITKEALQEGWDCPFAYILTLLDKTTAQTAMTQMVGRVLRQPEATSTSIESLNNCYVYCFDQDVRVSVQNVRKGLEEEGMSDLADYVRAGDDVSQNNPQEAQSIKVRRRSKFDDLKIFLPKVLHRHGKNWREINYDADILATINWAELKYNVSEFLSGKDAPALTITTVDVARKTDLAGQTELEFIDKTIQEAYTGQKTLDIAFLSRQLIDIIPNPWQASRLVSEAIADLRAKGHSDEDIYNGRLFLIESMKKSLKAMVHEQSESIFKQKLLKSELVFRLTTSGDERLNFIIAKELQALARKNEPKLVNADNTAIENSLFEVVFEKDLNNLEKNLALYLSESSAVQWWHRMVARQEYALQGWQRNKVYPDFIACVRSDRIMVLETKGLQLKGNDDTEYKRKLFDLLTEQQNSPVAAGVIDIVSDQSKKISFHMLMEDTWQEEMQMQIRL